MQLLRLQVEGVRCLAGVDLQPGAGLNVLTGANGAGKTSVLEAIGLLASGRSFRSRQAERLVNPARGGFEVYGEVQRSGAQSRIAVVRSGEAWRVRVDGQDESGFGGLGQYLAALFFEPESHELLAGGSEGRRRFLDWGVFHVEPGFGALWARYQRALRQRNALLKRSSLDPAELQPWNAELASSGTLLTEARQRFVQAYLPVLRQHTAQLGPELGEPRFRLRDGWSGPHLGEELEISYDRDRLLGHTSKGPHRADWTLNFAVAGGREQLSRGQQKLACFALHRALLDVFIARRGEPPLVCLDDLFSELDREHQARALESLAPLGAQVWITGTESGPALQRWPAALNRFHVEHGRVSALDADGL